MNGTDYNYNFLFYIIILTTMLIQSIKSIKFLVYKIVFTRNQNTTEFVTINRKSGERRWAQLVSVN